MHKDTKIFENHLNPDMLVFILNPIAKSTFINAQEYKIFGKPSKLCRVGIHTLSFYC